MRIKVILSHRWVRGERDQGRAGGERLSKYIVCIKFKKGGIEKVVFAKVQCHKLAHNRKCSWWIIILILIVTV